MKKKKNTVSQKDIRYTHPTNGACCTSEISFRVRNGRIYNTRFDGGCSGNTQGLTRLLEGRTVREVIRRVSGIRCGEKSTSCPDQLAQALKRYLAQKKTSQKRSVPRS